MESYARFLMDRCAPMTVASYLGQLHMFLKHVWPETDWRWLCEMQAQQRLMADPIRPKAARIVPQHALVELGLDLMEQAEALPVGEELRAGPRHPALVFRDGLMIATLAMRPLRLRNFLGLQIHRHLCREAEGWVISIPASETKTHQSLHMPFPELLVAALERYIDGFRSLLLEMRGPSNRRHGPLPAGSHLWVSRCGTPMTPAAMEKLLERHTPARFGHYINAHLFRDCVASSVADEHPDRMRIVADLLGHRSLRTTERNYIVANQRAALRRVSALIDEHRKTAHVVRGQGTGESR